MFEDLLVHMINHAKEVYPREAVGFVAQDRYFPMQNVAEDKENNFVVHSTEYLRYSSRIQAIVHSHPEGPNYPNKVDMQSQIDTDVPWGILPIYKQEDSFVTEKIIWWGDAVPIPPLVGRGFIHGVTDCYSLIRDYYRLTFDTTFPEFPRDWQWWADGDNLYEDNFRKVGMVEVEMADAKEGDIFLACLRNKKPNHGGIYLGGPASEILHHLTSSSGNDPSWLSKKEPGVRYLKYIQNGGYWLRHKDLL